MSNHAPVSESAHPIGPFGTASTRGLVLWLVLGGWTLFALFTAAQRYIYYSLQRPQHQFSFGWLIASGLIESALWALVTLAIFWLAWRFPLERARLLRHIGVHVVAAALLSTLRVVAIVAIASVGDFWPDRPFARQFLTQYNLYFLFYWLLLGIAHAVHYHARYREREEAAQRLSTSLAEARLQALKLQLHPHFLFNTLHAISALIPRDAKPAIRMVARLGELLRIALEHEATQEVTLRDELDFLTPYLEIEQLRLGDRLVVERQIADDVLDACVPHLMLQPLVENAVRHGVASRVDGGRVVIGARRRPEGTLQLSVRDFGPGLRSGAGSKRNGIGLLNIRARLEQLYGPAHHFAIADHAAGGVLATITIPFRTTRHEGTE